MLNKIFSKIFKDKKSKGISLIIALFTMTLILSISFSVGSIILRQLRIINTTVSSQTAFYAADSAVECAAYWDRDPTNEIFGSSTATTYFNQVACGPTGAISGVNKQVDPVLSIATSTFSIDYSTTDYKACAYVTVIWEADRTQVYARGYNSGLSAGNCDLTNAVARRIVERGIQYTQ